MFPEDYTLIQKIITVIARSIVYAGLAFVIMAKVAASFT